MVDSRGSGADDDAVMKSLSNCTDDKHTPEQVTSASHAQEEYSDMRADGISI